MLLISPPYGSRLYQQFMSKLAISASAPMEQVWLIWPITATWPDQLPTAFSDMSGSNAENISVWAGKMGR
nr:hypothetical protein [Leptolyngbya sp. 7M]